MDFGVVGLDHHHHHQNHHGLGVSSCFSSEAGFASNNVTSSSSPSDPEANKHQRALLYGSEFSSVKQERSSGPSLEEYWRSSKVAKTDGGGSDAVDDDFSSSVCKGMMFQQRNNNNNDNNNNASLLLRSNSNTSNNTLSFLDNGSYNNNSHSQQHQMLSFCSTSPTKSEAHSNAATLAYFPNALSAYTATRNTGYNNNNSNNSSMMMMMSMQGNGGVMMRSGPFTASQRMELQQQALMYKYISANVPIPSHLLIPIRNAIAFRPSTTNPFGGGVWGTAFQLGFANNADPEPGRCRRTDGKKWRCSRDAVADQKYCERHMNRGRHRSRKPVEGPVAAAISNNIPAANTAAVAKPSFELNHSASSTRTFAKGNASAAAASASSREFGLVTSVDSLMLNQKPSLSSHHQNSLHQFMDSWPDRTQLSISIPNTPFTTETSLSPLRLSNATATARQAQWIPITWEGSSPGGPLGEVLNKPGSNGNIVCDHHHSKSASSTPSSSVLNLMPEGGACWDGSPPLGSSPTGVLQKTAFGSLSNSSAGSSPARAHDRPAAVNIDLLPPPHLGSSSSLPAL